MESELAQLYRVKTLHLYGGIQGKTFQAQQDLALLKQALTGGQISMIEYFVGIRHLSKSSELPPTGESISEGNGTVYKGYKFHFDLLDLNK